MIPAHPELAMRLAACDVLLPGAAQQSSTVAPHGGLSTWAGKQLAWWGNHQLKFTILYISTFNLNLH